MIMFSKIFLLSVFCVSSTYSARILALVTAPMYSHQVVYRPIWRELSKIGHQVTLLTTDPMRDPTLTNLTEVDLSVSYNKWNEMNVNKMANLSVFQMLDTLMSVTTSITEEQFILPEVQNIIKNKMEHFDLVMMEFMLPATIAFAERFDCPLILMTPVDPAFILYHYMGNPSHPIVNPDFLLSFPKRLSFFQRLSSSLYVLCMQYLFKYRVMPIQDELIRRTFGDEYPSVEEILYNRTSMLFVNTDTVFHMIRPLLPNVIQIGGGTHLTPPKPLPKELKSYLDSAPNGFIYFSLGSNIKSERLPEEAKKILLETFSELPYKILWKFENENLPGKSDNVMIRKWLPQQDILRHPNIKLFINQGGLQSSEEAIYNHVPMVNIPLLGDQQTNAMKMIEKGVSVSIDFKTIDKPTLKAAILEVANNPSYRSNVKELAELAKDQPMTGLQRAIWWTEYVLRHKGAAHLRSPALDLPAYQYYLLDVIAFCLTVLLIVVYVLIKLAILFFRVLRYFMPNPKIKTQ